MNHSELKAAGYKLKRFTFNSASYLSSTRERRARQVVRYYLEDANGRLVGCVKRKGFGPWTAHPVLKSDRHATRQASVGSFKTVPEAATFLINQQH